MDRKIVGRVISFLVLIFLVACQTQAGGDQPRPTSASDAIETLSQVSTGTPIPPDHVVFIDRLSEWDSIRHDLLETMEVIAAEEGWVMQSLPDFSALNSQEEPHLIVVAGGSADFTEPLRQYPDTYFIIIGVPGVEPGARVAVIGPEGLRTDEIAFLAGYISALITPEWRTGVIGVGNTGEGKAAIQGFINGAVFFCGLCRIEYPPFYDYPLSTTVADSGQSSLRSGYDLLSAQAVTTIGLTQEFASGAVDTIINETKGSGIYWIGPNPPSPGNLEHWIATVLPDPSRNLANAYYRLVAGEDRVQLPMSFDLRDAHPNFLTDGKLELIHEVMRDLERGLIDTGIDPMTGEVR